MEELGEPMYISIQYVQVEATKYNRIHLGNRVDFEWQCRALKLHQRNYSGLFHTSWFGRYVFPTLPEFISLLMKQLEPFFRS